MIYIKKENTMKKVLALTSSIILAFTMAACGSTASHEASSGTLSSAAETTTESSEAVQESAPAAEES